MYIDGQSLSERAPVPAGCNVPPQAAVRPATIVEIVAPLLESLNLSKETLNALRDLTLIKALLDTTANLETTTAVNPQSLEKAGIISAETLTNASHLKDQLTSIGSDSPPTSEHASRLAQHTALARAERQDELAQAPLPKYFDHLRTLERALEDGIPKSAEKAAVPSTKPEMRLSLRVEKSVDDVPKPLLDRNALKSIIPQQISALATVEERVRSLLTASSTTIFSPLLETLNSAAKELALTAPANQQQRELREFVSTLSTSLQKALRTSEPGEVLRPKLAQALLTIHDKFGLTTLTERATTPTLPAQEIPPPQTLSTGLVPSEMRLLKALEVQIKNILALPPSIFNKELEQAVKGDQEAQKQILKLIAPILKTLDALTTPITSQELRAFAHEAQTKLVAMVSNPEQAGSFPEEIAKLQVKLGQLLSPVNTVPAQFLPLVSESLTIALPRHEAAVLTLLRDVIGQTLEAMAHPDQNSTGPHQSSALLKTLATYLTQLVDDPSQTPEARRFIETLSSRLSAVRTPAASLETVLKSALNEIDLLERSPTHATASRSSVSLQVIDAIIRSAYESASTHSTLPNSVEESPHHPSAGIGAPQSIRIQQALKQLTFALPEFGSLKEQELASFTTELSHKLSSRGASGLAPEEAKSALTALRSQFLTYPVAAQASPLSAFSTRTLQMFEQFAETQQTLSAVAPLLKAAGEPTLILFPLFIHGLLSKLEVQYQAPPAKDCEQEDRAESATSPQLFSRLLIKLELPKLGPLQADIAYRAGEILLNITCHKEEAINLLRSKMGIVEYSLRALGYRKLDCSVALGN